MMWEEREALLHVARQLGGGLLAGDRPRRRRAVTAAIASATSSCGTPSSAAASTCVEPPSAPARRCASASVNSADTAPAELSAVPKRTVPTSVYSWLPELRDACVTRVADLELAVLGGGDVEGDLVVGLGPAALGERRRG